MITVSSFSNQDCWRKVGKGVVENLNILLKGKWDNIKQIMKMSKLLRNYWSQCFGGTNKGYHLWLRWTHTVESMNVHNLEYPKRPHHVKYKSLLTWFEWMSIGFEVISPSIRDHLLIQIMDLSKNSNHQMEIQRNLWFVTFVRPPGTHVQVEAWVGLSNLIPLLHACDQIWYDPQLFFFCYCCNKCFGSRIGE